MSLQIVKISNALAAASTELNVVAKKLSGLVTFDELCINGDRYIIRVKIIRLWKTWKKSTGNGIEMILADEKGNRIHATVEGEAVNGKYPFKMRRRQFPLTLAFAMTINKSQGQSLEHVGLYLPRPVFSHGQLYVALSRAKSRDEVKVLITDKDGKVGTTTTNVVFKEIFQNIK